MYVITSFSVSCYEWARQHPPFAQLLKQLTPKTKRSCKHKPWS